MGSHSSMSRRGRVWATAPVLASGPGAAAAALDPRTATMHSFFAPDLPPPNDHPPAARRKRRRERARKPCRCSGYRTAALSPEKVTKGRICGRSAVVRRIGGQSSALRGGLIPGARVRHVSGNRLVEQRGARPEASWPAAPQPTENTLLQGSRSRVHLLNKNLEVGALLQELAGVPRQVAWNVADRDAILSPEANRIRVILVGRLPHSG